MHRHRSIVVFAVLALLCLGLPACSEKGEKAESSARAGGPSDYNSAPAATADEAIMRVSTALADGKPQIAWDGLPPSYQKDVTELIHEAAATTDPELWGKSFSVLGKLSRVLSEKQEFVFEHPMLAAQIEDREEAEEAWGAIVGLFDTVVRSELADPATVANLDVREFLAGTGTEVMAQVTDLAGLAESYGQSGDPMARLRDLEATVLASEGDTARVRIEAPGVDPKEVDYVRVEQRWVSKELADGWSEQMAEARQDLANYSSDADEGQKQTTLMQLSMAESALDGLLAANSADEFNARMGAVMGMAMGAMMSQAATASAAVEPSYAPQPMAAEVQQPTAVAGSMPAPTAMRSADTPPVKYPDFIEVADANDYLGRVMRVTGNDGTDMRAKLVEVRDDVLVFERELGGGTVALEVAASSIEQLELGR